jgi:hypothetical protein
MGVLAQVLAYGVVVVALLIETSLGHCRFLMPDGTTTAETRWTT